MNSPFSEFITFLSAVLRCGIPLVLFYTLVQSIGLQSDKKRAKFRLMAVICGIVVGFIFAHTTTATNYFSEYSLFLAILLIALGLIGFVLSFPAGKKAGELIFFYGSLPFLVVVAMQGASDLWVILHDQASGITVLNTNQIINIAAILIGFVMIVWLAKLFSRFTARLKSGVNRIIFLFFYLLLALQWLANVLINLIRLDYLKASKGLISYVAKCHAALTTWNYIVITLALIILLLFYFRRNRGVTEKDTALPEPEKRKLTIAKLIDIRECKTAIVLLALTAASQLWYDTVVTRPPELSPALPIEADAEGLVKIKIADIADGHLHRYAYITGDGYRVRFFIIQRYENSDKFGVVFDACQICGDDGYLERAKNIICSACNVSIFVPSIGKAGGCNPIPFNAKTGKEYIIITAEELEAGATYFSEKIEITVTDPVSGAKISNLKAPFHYSFKGHEFSFESEDNMKKFVEDPEKYAKVKRRSMRIDGYKE